MTGWDPSTIASVTALIVAVLALIIALAQAVQQYFITGQLIRICDSVVFGPMPGQGRRVWQLSQFRFRVLYSIPQISLRAGLWPSDSGLVKSYAIGRHPLPRLAGGDGDVHDDPRSLVEMERWRKWKTQARAFPMRVTPWRREPSVEEEDYGHMQVIVGHPEVVPLTKRRRFFQRGRFSGSRLKRLFKRKLFFWSRWTRFFRRKLFSASWWSSLVTGRKARTSFTSSSIVSTVTSSSARSATETVDSRRVGEASWVSFCRAIEMSCGNSVRFDYVQYDADRCPSDLVSAPMQVSMRDIIIMGLMAGMGITSASFKEKSVSMQGAVGTITTSNHAVLGPILHFTPRNTDEDQVSVFGCNFGHRRGFVDGYWLVRTWGVCSVARRYFNWKSRRTVRRLDDRWIRDQEDSTWNPHDGSKGDGAPRSRNRKYASYRRAKNGWMGGSVGRYRGEKQAGSQQSKNPAAEGEETNRRGKEVIKISRAIPERRPQDGNWIILPPPPTEQVPRSAVNQQGHAKKLRQGANVSTNKEPKTHDAAHTAPGPPSSLSQEDATPEDRLRPPRPTRRATVEDASDHEGEFPSNGPMPEARNLPLGTEAVAKPDFKERLEKTTPTPPIISHQVAVESVTRSIEAKETVVSSAEEERLERTDVRDDKELSERVQTAKKLQATRAEKLRQIQHDKDIVEKSVKRGVIHSPHDEPAEQRTQLLLTNYTRNEKDASKEDEENKDEGGDKPTKEEQEAQERQSKRNQDRMQRDNERERRNQARQRSLRLDKVDLYWMSQMDVMRGYWATSWHKPHTTPVYSALSGCVTVVLEALLGFLGSEYIVYRSRSFYATATCMCRQSFSEDEDSYNYSYPAYAHNAQGGFIASGCYIGCRISSFSSRVMPVLELAHSYNWQVADIKRDQTEVEEQNVELMCIDSWLSYVGRLDEISEGPHRLLHQAPALVQLLMEEFEDDFENIDLSAKEGGLQDIQGLAANVMDFLTDEELTEAEQLYVLVALLRSVKVAQCVLSGSDTADLQDILEKDVQVHLV